MGFETGAGEFMQNSAVGTYSAAQMRRSVFAWAARTSANVEGTIVGGLMSSTDMQLSNAVSGLVVYTSVGACLIGGTEATSQGGYHGFVSSQNSTTLATANGSNPRIDLICATASDPQYTIPTGGTSGYATIVAVTGTPTSGASLSNLSGVGSLPASSLLLGYVLVPAAATNLSSGDIKNVATQVQMQPITAGRTLATVTYNPGGGTTYTSSSTAPTVVDGSNLVASITAPPSGAVRLSFEALMATALGTAALIMTVWNNTASSEYSNSLRVNMIQQASGVRVRYDAYVGSLTPGSVYSLGPGFASSGASDVVSIYAGNTSGLAGAAWLEIAAA